MTTPLLDLSLFEEVFAPLSGKKVGYIRNPFGNAGDGLIHGATLQLFEHYGVNYRVLNPRPRLLPHREDVEELDEIVLYGGGSMGYPLSGRFRAQFRKIDYGIRTTLLPQSFRGSEDAPYDSVWIRERYSISYCPKARLAHDLALAYQPRVMLGEPDDDVGIFLRRDQETAGPADSHRNGLGDPVDGLRMNEPDEYIRRAARYFVIITDRLHFAISGLLARRKVILLPNSYHKNHGVFEHSLQALGCLWCNGIGEAMSVVKPLRLALAREAPAKHRDWGLKPCRSISGPPRPP